MLKNIVLERPLVVIHLAATGTDETLDRIIEIRVLKLWPGGALSHRITRLNPGGPIPGEATAVHGISDDDVAELLPFREIAPELARYLDGCDLCGFNILKYDLGLLAAEFRRAGVRFRILGRKIIDVPQLLFKLEARDPNVFMHYCDMARPDVFTSAADVLWTLEILDDVVSGLDLPRTVDGLHALCYGPKALGASEWFGKDHDGLIVFLGGKYKGRSLDDIARTEPGYLDWMLRQDFFYEDAKELASEALEHAHRIGAIHPCQGLVGR
jgi:DNA polymerase-3 subunit epsilon